MHSLLRFPFNEKVIGSASPCEFLASCDYPSLSLGPGCPYPLPHVVLYPMLFYSSTSAKPKDMP